MLTHWICFEHFNSSSRPKKFNPHTSILNPQGSKLPKIYVKVVGICQFFSIFACEMANTLTIDRGNTSTKIAVWASRDAESPLLLHSFLTPSARDIANCIKGMSVASAIVSSVAGDIPGLREALEADGVSLLKLVGDTPLPLTMNYETPETLGTDRIAALVGARSLLSSRNVLVVDIGTAVTYDFLNSDGTFVGGNIAPGIGMRLEALHAFTSRLPEVSSHGRNGLWGTTTETAMRNGAINGVVAEISYYRSQLPEGSVTMLTGGRCEDIAERLPFENNVDKLLVLRGLNSILHYNEDL